MSGFDMYAARREYAESFSKFLEDPDTLKGFYEKINTALTDVQSEFEYWIESDMADNLASYIQRMAEHAIDAILQGDEEGMRRYLKCQEHAYSGRDCKPCIINGKLHETGAIELRRQIVNAFPELLKSERMLDLEAQVNSLVEENNKLKSEIVARRLMGER